MLIPGPFTLLRRLKRDERGAVIIEFALALSALTLLTVGVINAGLAFVEKMNVTNAVRAGSQLALVRHPSLDPAADTDPSVVSLNDIRDAVIESARFLDNDPGGDLTVCIFYQCPGDPPTACVTTQGTLPSCADRLTLLTISLDHVYNFVIPMPGFTSGIDLSASHTVRLS